MKYYVTIKVDACFVAEVEAENPCDARAKAGDVFSNADFGAATDIEGEAIIVEDENGDILWAR